MDFLKFLNWLDTEDDDLHENPSIWSAIIVGLLMAGFFAFLACQTMAAGEGKSLFLVDGMEYLLRGVQAQVLALELGFIAAYLHFHYFWSLFPSMDGFRQFVRVVSMIGLIVTTIYIAWYAIQHPEQRVRPAQAGEVISRA